MARNGRHRLSVVQRYIARGTGYAGAPLIHIQPLCAAVLLRFGTGAEKRCSAHLQRRRFLVQGYSEPGSGSDLASLKTKQSEIRILM
jgi:alkylation response protein AidB-like acyl-CoA dehydrogenase